jgi:hypothetical protein
MESRKQILTELQEIAPFLGETDCPLLPYRVPVGYFSDFMDILMIRIGLEKTGDSKTAAEEISELSPLLAGLPRTQPYHVPQGFFESSQKRIPEAVKVPSRLVAIKPASINRRVISMPMRLARYAAAACIVAGIGIATFTIRHTPKITDPILGLATVSDQDMADYLDVHDVHWTPGVSANTSTAGVDFSDDDIHDLLRGVPDIELEQYSATLPEQKGTVN